MSRLDVNTLRHTAGSADNITLDNSQNVTVEGNLTVDGTTTLTGAVTLPAGTTSDTLSFRNLIINGAMQIAQRGTSDTSSGGYKTVDRFKPQCGGTDDAPTQAQISLTTSDTGPWAKGFRKAVQWTNGNQTAAGGGDYFEILYKTEGHDISSCGWDYTDPNSKITLSFWVKSSVAQNFYGFLRNDESTDKLYPFETGSLSANTWTKITKVIPGHADLTFNNGSGVGLQIHWTMFYGTNYTNNATSHQWMTLDIANFTADQTSTWYTTNDATFALTGVQLEVGSSATEFEHRSYGEDLARCQRYYEQSDSIANATTGNWWFYPFGAYELWGPNSFRVEKRDTPTITTYTNAGATGGAHRLGSPDVSSITAQKISRYGVQKLGKSDGGLTAGNPYICGWSAASEL